MADKEGETEEEAGILPGIIGAASAAANSAPGKALLAPAANALGNYWGERMEEITQKWREQRRRNIEDYQKRVLDVEKGAINLNNEKQFGLISEWAETAQTVDEQDDPELSALWSSVLGNIVKGRAVSKELLDIVKNLDGSDARVLFAMEGKYLPEPEELSTFQRLAALRVMNTFSFDRNIS